MVRDKEASIVLRLNLILEDRYRKVGNGGMLGEIGRGVFVI